MQELEFNTSSNFESSDQKNIDCDIEIRPKQKNKTHKYRTTTHKKKYQFNINNNANQIQFKNIDLTPFLDIDGAIFIAACLAVFELIS